MSENPSPSQSGAALSTPQTSPSAPLRAADAGPVSELSHSSTPAPPPPRFNLSLPSASQPDIIRANQKDAYYQEILKTQVKDAIGSRFQHQYQTEINVFSDLCYYSLTTLLGMQTLGEEYCDIMQISNTTKTFPTLARRSALVFWHVLMPYLYSKGSQELRRRTRPQPQHQQRRFGQTHLDAALHDQGAKPATPAWRQKLKKTIHDWLPSVQTFLKTHGHSAHLAIFYFFGAYYSLSKRVTGIRYIFNRKLSPGEERSGYEVLGVLIVIQLAIQLVQWRRQTVAATQEKAAAAALASGAGVGKESLLDKNAVEEEEEEDEYVIVLWPFY
ncbi:peroxisome biogenesis factor 10 [Actinomortierella ambigua]|nr:peroxisome biogenesis factor 10 [Actinomortierella ambigua]